MRKVLGLTAAAFVPAFVMVAWYAYGSFDPPFGNDGYAGLRIRNFAIIATFISGGHVALLGVPAFLLLDRLRAIRWWSSVLAGFILGAVPVAIWSWPLRYPELKGVASTNGVQTMIDGIPTMAGWVQYANGLSAMGAFGFIGGLAFWLITRTEYQQSAKAELRKKHAVGG